MVMSFLFIVLAVMLAIAFFTLMEVQILGVIHQRMGPTKVGILGTMQPFGDFIKLFSKVTWLPKKMEKFLFLFSPMISILIGILIWGSFGMMYPVSSVKWSLMSFFMLSSFLVYFLLMMGWSSGSYFSLLGSFRSVSQTISYEVVLFFIIFPIIVYHQSFKLSEISMSSFMMFMFLTPVFMIWLFSCLAESNRSPFDFSEGESELVSGFNTEILGGFFTFIFITEYGFMMFLGFLTVMFFMGTSMFFLKQLMVISFFIIVRGVYPRMRFDILMMMVWKKFLPLVVATMILILTL
uniref:NADH-ubiquinone oxidoreductase chain 1 n=1 Tax=Ascoschoengastia sp. TATW-1 TaxID=436354 RepID=B3IUM8_9ACAR|nr:NADH dehydrogenase subunit 1 [Ascoschoengastia sp. TATW-1]